MPYRSTNLGSRLQPIFASLKVGGSKRKPNGAQQKGDRNLGGSRG
jgi:hypothetical protein